MSEEKWQGQAISPLHQGLYFRINVVLKPLLRRIIRQEFILVLEMVRSRMGGFLSQIRTASVVSPVPGRTPDVSPLGRLRSVSWLLLVSERGVASLGIQLPLPPTHVAVCSVPVLQPSRSLQTTFVRLFECGIQGGAYDHWWRHGRGGPSWHARDRRAARRLSHSINSPSSPGGASSE